MQTKSESTIAENDTIAESSLFVVSENQACETYGSFCKSTDSSVCCVRLKNTKKK